MQMRSLGIRALILAGACALTAVTLRASDMVGVYAMVDKAVLEPTDAAPVRVQIWGVFATASGRGEVYGEAQKGYLDHVCPAGQETTCRNEWSDIKSVAGKGQAVGFGMRYKPTGRIRAASEKPANPDPYPIDAGVMKVGSDAYHAAIAAKLKAQAPAK